MSSNFLNGQNNLIITEFLASNSTQLQDEDGDYPDWIEIYNPNDFGVSLSGWSLTDNKAVYTKWTFPDFTIEGKQYIVVFASGKDRKSAINNLHTNFQLSSTGEFLALSNPGGTVITTIFINNYPAQYTDISYGLINGEFVYLNTPTPGAANDSNTYNMPPVFSVKHGHFYEAFTLEISADKNAKIYYTTNASTPGKSNGILYSEPIKIDKTTVVRAIAIKDDTLSGISVTQTYIFPNDVITQPRYPEGYPKTWLQPVEYPDKHKPIDSDYGMSSTIVNNATVKPVITEALLDLPVVSLVSDIDNFFSESMDPEVGGIYNYTGASDGSTSSLNYHLGRGWTRAASVEYFNTEKDKINFQANCVMKIHGGASRTPSKTAKHSFKIGFKSEYGPSELKQKIFGKGTPDQYDWLILRGGFGTRYGLQLYDPFTKSTMRDMGQYAAYSQFVHVYLNGMYWGVYNLSERMDDNCISDHFGGKPEDYDIVKDYYEVESGSMDAFEKLITMAKGDMTKEENYQRILGNNADGTPNAAYEKMVDPTNLADYMLMNFYVGNTDWNHHNWLAFRSKSNPEGFRFVPWDCEYVIRNADSDVADEDNDSRPSGIFVDLMANVSFQNLFISRINKHFFEGGGLIPKNGFDRYSNWRDIIDTAIVCESARWNDSKGQKDDIWETSYHTFIDDYFPVRTEIAFKQLIKRKMYPSIDVPAFNINTSTIENTDELFMNSTGGKIWYTLNGTDPGYYSPEENMKGVVFVYDGKALPLPPAGETLTIMARVKQDSLWSTLVTKKYIIKKAEIKPNAVKYLSENNDINFISYPDPTTENCNLKFSLTETSLIGLKIYDVLGKQLYAIEERVLEAGEHVIQLNIRSIPSGVYYGILENKENSTLHRTKIVKK